MSFAMECESIVFHLSYSARTDQHQNPFRKLQKFKPEYAAILLK